MAVTIRFYLLATLKGQCRSNRGLFLKTYEIFGLNEKFACSEFIDSGFMILNLSFNDSKNRISSRKMRLVFLIRLWTVIYENFET